MAVVLAALPELIIAIVLTLIIWGARALFGGMISSFASRIPLLGHVLETALDAIIADVVTTGRRWAATSINAVYGFVLAPVFWVEHILADIWDTFDVIRQVLAYITGTLIQLAVNLAVQEATVLINRVRTEVTSVIDQVYSITQVEFRQVYATIDAVEKALAAYIAAEIQAVEQDLTRAISAETAFVQASVHALENQITAAITAETAFVEREFQSSIAYTLATAQAIETTIATDTSAITAWVTEQILSLTGAIDLVQSATAALAISAAAAVEADLNTLKTECTDNLCSGLGGAASLINQLLGAGWISMLLGYAAWGASDPAGCGHATADVLAPIAAGAKDTVVAAAGAF